MTETVIIYKPDWLLYDNGLRHKRVKKNYCLKMNSSQVIASSSLSNSGGNKRLISYKEEINYDCH